MILLVESLLQLAASTLNSAQSQQRSVSALSTTLTLAVSNLCTCAISSALFLCFASYAHNGDVSRFTSHSAESNTSRRGISGCD